MPNLPSGTVTFAFTDIEGSTDLLKRLGDTGYQGVLAIHRRLLRDAFAAHDGQEIDTQGDAFFYSFPRARQAVAAAVDVQRAHEQHDWPDGTRVRIRIGLHTGEPVIGEEGYTGLDVVRAARIAAVGRGGQVLLSETTRALVGAVVPDGVEVRALGSHRLKDIDQPEALHELRIDGVGTAPATAAPGAGEASSALAPAPPTSPAPLRLQHPEVPDLASIMAGLPDFVRDAAQGELGAKGSPTDVIEQRVLAELRESLSQPARRGRGPGPRRAPRRPVPAARQAGALPTGASGASMASELERLQALRDSGALTPQQYGRAVDRVLEGDR
jgi:class 3 adenylate cyclase